MDESLMDMFETINVTQGFFSEIPWVRSVALKYMNLQGESPFRRSVFLETVRLIGNRLEEIPQDLLWGINNLRTLKIQYQNIKSLSPASFTKITSYLDKEISLESVNLTTIEPGTFAKFDYLKTLSLAFNKLQVLTADMFKGLERLQILRLNSNQINMIQPATFDGVINIHELLLESNKLTSLPDGCFVKLDSLEVLNLDVDWTPFDIIGRARSLFTETYWLKHIKPVLDEFRQLQ
ncbi:leucine-rich repeat transmembrane neuronal protein 4-like [Fopius arisanus]|uniref:Leucine-rich repeat transmembrane neuronal protein 4-like n=1 Tax=Fopius arisanus TaxID=64838 RepID=A0A9R1T2V8_9HYME|nr:PREDICTED: leucine-rich repeat transmembrane neuronal protein 4-like [Fopius arisanus]